MANRLPVDAALADFPPGRLVRLGDAALWLEIAPDAGGRIARIVRDGTDWLVTPDEAPAMIAWGCYPMLPWAGRLRGGRFTFDGYTRDLPANLGPHAIHGVGFALPWQIDVHTLGRVELSLQLPEDARWPFGGTARHCIGIDGRALHLELSIRAGAQAMPMPVLGWHPWFRKPERMEFAPHAMFPRDRDGIATRPTRPPVPGPWDDCFLNRVPVVLHRNGQRLSISSGCTHWVVYDHPAHATCVEPQTGPPDAFNLDAGARLPAGASLSTTMVMEWS